MSQVPSESDDSRRSGTHHPGKNRDSPSDQNSSRGQQGSKRFTFPSWPDEQDRDLCPHALVVQPERTPISGRTGLATAKWGVVDRQESRILICNRLHEGECEWPWDVQAG
jgi:hypothetical protein